ncbi:hypothetical protein [Massilia aerilata]|uniref:DUF1449 family protein n=1 Tax=Massilia aerilata TaxID=453817 RepID=A0ABW0RWK6_9BURK
MTPLQRGCARLAKVYSWGIVCAWVLVFPFGIRAHPVLWLGKADFTHLVGAGFACGVAVLIVCRLALGSWSGFLGAALSPRAPQYPIRASVYLFAVCLAWGFTTYFSANILARATAAEHAFLDARYITSYRTKSCGRLAEFDTDVGVAQVCLPNSLNEAQPQLAGPDALRSGEPVRLEGRRNSLAFVVDAVLRRR